MYLIAYFACLLAPTVGKFTLIVAMFVLPRQNQMYWRNKTGCYLLCLCYKQNLITGLMQTDFFFSFSRFDVTTSNPNIKDFDYYSIELMNSATSGLLNCPTLYVKISQGM